jgi:hypothetical protein
MISLLEPGDELNTTVAKRSGHAIHYLGLIRNILCRFEDAPWHSPYHSNLLVVMAGE